MRRLRAFFVAVVTWLGIHPAQGGIPVVLDNGELPSLAPLVEQAKPAVVTVFAIRPRSAQSTPPGGSPGEASTPGIGSGVIVDAKKGIVLTSFSNVAGASELTVLLLDGRLLDAKVVGGDPVTDLAVLHVEAENLKALRMADSDGLRVGDFVLAIGNPFGVGKSVSSGIVSGLGRASSQAATFTDHIQTDAPINPGSSGGALINLRGELVGIATGLLGPVPVNVGIGFAVPSNTAFLVLVQILEHGEVRTGSQSRRGAGAVHLDRPRCADRGCARGNACGGRGLAARRRSHRGGWQPGPWIGADAQPSWIGTAWWQGDAVGSARGRDSIDGSETDAANDGRATTEDRCSGYRLMTTREAIRFGELRAQLPALEHPMTEAFLQLLQLDRESELRSMQSIGDPPEGAGMGDGPHAAEVVEVERNHPVRYQTERRDSNVEPERWLACSGTRPCRAAPGGALL
jgi:hypothetical protein